jgi:hypothetical protein
MTTRTTRTAKKAAATKSAKSKRRAGIGGDKFVVETRGRSFYVVDSESGVVVGGPYPTRAAAQNHADEFQRRKPRGR